MKTYCGFTAQEYRTMAIGAERLAEREGDVATELHLKAAATTFRKCALDLDDQVEEVPERMTGEEFAEMQRID